MVTVVGLGLGRGVVRGVGDGVGHKKKSRVHNDAFRTLGCLCLGPPFLAQARVFVKCTQVAHGDSHRVPSHVGRDVVKLQGRVEEQTNILQATATFLFHA